MGTMWPVALFAFMDANALCVFTEKRGWDWETGDRGIGTTWPVALFAFMGANALCVYTEKRGLDWATGARVVISKGGDRSFGLPLFGHSESFGNASFGDGSWTCVPLLDHRILGRSNSC